MKKTIILLLILNLLGCVTLFDLNKDGVLDKEENKGMIVLSVVGLVGTIAMIVGAIIQLKLNPVKPPTH